MDYKEIFESMKVVAEAAMERGYLQHYQKDFYELDYEILKDNWTSEGRFIWVLTPNGTHLCEIGIHDRQRDFARAAINSGYFNTEIYLVTAKSIKPMTVEQAVEAIRQPSVFAVRGDHVVKQGEGHIADMHIKPFRTEKFDPAGLARFTKVGKPWSEYTKHALRVIGNNEISRRYGSFFVCCQIELEED